MKEQSEFVRHETRENVAILRLNHPPINSLDYATRTKLVEVLELVSGDEQIKAIVITGTGKMFSGGADIREFNTPDMTREPNLLTLIEVVENSAKPIVAAVNSAAMGGGLELALACHYRVATPNTEVSLPEVKLGLLPGAGGTQRLPRLVGLELALNMIVTGSPVPAKQLGKTLLFEQVAPGDLLECAFALAKHTAERGGPYPRARDLNIDHDQAEAFLQFSRQAIAVTAKNYPAPQRCVDAIEAAVKRPFEEGLAVERQLFIELLNTLESKALRHVFFAERAAGKIPGLPEAAAERQIRKVAVVGAGTMGTGISMNFLNAGIPVTIVEADQPAIERGLSIIRKNYFRSVVKGKITAEEIDRRLELLKTTLRMEEIAEADLVIEAVFEELPVKETVFRELDRILKPGSILATNTSTLDVNKIAGFTNRPADVLGTHFFSPANVMKLLEVVRGEKTSPEVLAAIMHLARAIKKTAVVSGVCDGFIGNRMIGHYFRQAEFLLEEGCFPEEVDRAIENFGFAMGPFRVGDLAGNDIGWAIQKRRAAENPQFKYPQVGMRLCEEGRFGQKTGTGWYDYPTDSQKPRPSEKVNDLIIETSKKLGLPRRQISEREIVERLVYSLVNEGAKILEEGIAARPSDIDIVYLYGYGFPAWRGGPMFYADTVGPYNVVRAIRNYQKGTNGDVWNLAGLLVEFGSKGKQFASMN
jgi:3-hydroxyacyl-CoA dehydrogenase